MIPGMNPRQMQGMMKKMGIRQTEVDATEVIILTPDKKIRILNPEVLKVNMMGQETFQITGQEVEESLEQDFELEISEDDVATVVEQTGVSAEVARQTILEENGDLAQAILRLSENSE